MGTERLWHSGNGMPQSLTYDFKTPKSICSVSFLPRSGYDHGNLANDCPQSWKFEGSNDGANWLTLVHVPKGEECKADVRIERDVDIPRPFQMYKLETTKVKGRGTYSVSSLTTKAYVVLRDVQMFESTAPALA